MNQKEACFMSKGHRLNLGKGLGWNTTHTEKEAKIKSYTAEYN
jgi:hypothetical protein